MLELLVVCELLEVLWELLDEEELLEVDELEELVVWELDEVV